MAETATATQTPAATAPKKPVAAANAPKMLERAIVDLTFASSPSAARKVLNQIASSSQQFYIIRTLHVRNKQDKGPPREQSAGASGAGSAPNASGSAAAANPTPSSALKFIVGNEHIETSATIEIVRFTF